MFQDYLLHATDVEVRYAFRMAHLSGVVQRAQALHGLNDQRAMLLGETLLAGCLIASVLDDEERVNLRVQCGDDYTIATENSKRQEMRGYIACENTSVVNAIDLGERPLTALMIRSLRAQEGTGKIFEGVTKFLTNSFEEAFNDHIQQSYQVRARMRIDCWKDPSDGKLRAFGGIFFELPNLDDQVSERLWDHFHGLPLMRDLHAQGDDPDRLASQLIPDPTRPVSSMKPTWSCACSQESVERMLLSLPQDEIQDMVRKAETLDVQCHYCSTKYFVTPDRLKELLASLGTGSVSPHKH